MKALSLIGRVIFGGFFLYNGINHLKQQNALSAYARSKGVPNPEQAVPATGVALLAGGASVILGWKPELGALAIAGFLASVSPMMHNFWTIEDQGQRTNEMIHFSKNMALLGAALMLMNRHRS